MGRIDWKLSFSWGLKLDDLGKNIFIFILVVIMDLRN